MACQSRCEIQVQASRRRLLTACSTLSTPRNRAVWGLGCRSAGRLSRRITDDCGRALTCHVALAFNSPCRRSQTLRRDAALVSRPKEQATRPRVLLWVVFDRVIELSLRVDVRFDPESDQDRVATQYVAKGH